MRISGRKSIIHPIRKRISMKRIPLIPFLAALALSFLGLLLAIALVVLFTGSGRRVLPSQYEEQEVKERAKAAVDELCRGEYGAVAEMFGDEMKSLSAEALRESMSRMSEQTGELQEYESIVVMGYQQGEAVYAMAVVTGKCERGSAVYTITFNEDLEIIGLYRQ